MVMHREVATFSDMRTLRGLCASSACEALIGIGAALLPLAASAVPVGSEYPTTWTITNAGTSSAVATGTTPSGNTVTVTVTAPIVIVGSGTLLISGGAKPSYFPTTTTQALQFQINNNNYGTCTANSFTGCGTVTYTFSRPVQTPVLYASDVGAGSNSGGNWGAFHDSPWTLPAGDTFTLDSAGSQTASPSVPMSIQNSGASVGVTNPNGLIGQPVPPTPGSCSLGCGVYDVNGAGTLTSITFRLGYAGTGTSPDGFPAILGTTPVPTVRLAKTSINGVGTFNFSMTGLSNASDSITTTTAGSKVTSPLLSNATLGTPVVVTEKLSSSYLTSVSCSDSNSAFTGNTTAITSSSTSVTLPGANITPGAIWTCAYTNTAAANVSITKTDNLGGIYSPGGSGTYTIAVTNAATAAATVNGATVSDLLPAGLTVASPGIVCTPSGAGTSCSGSGSAVGTAGTGSLNVLAGLSLTLPPGGIVTITIPVTYSGTPASY